MNGIHPVVRYLIACEDIQIDPVDPTKVSLIALVSTIRAPNDLAYPLRFPELCLFLQLTECRGRGDGRIEIAHADSGRPIFRTQTRSIPFPTDPLEVVGLSFRIRDCSFREAGLYWLQFWYDEQMIVQQPLLVR